MKLTDRQQNILISLARYYLLSAKQVHSLCFEPGSNLRLARRDLAKLVDRGFARKHPMLVSNAQDGAPFPVYFISRNGCLLLHDLMGEDRYLHKPTRIVQRKHLHHYLAVAQTQILLRQAVGQQDRVNLCRWFNEEEIVNYETDNTKEHFRLYTEFRPKPQQLVCCPDAGFLLEIDGVRGAFYLEEDRGSAESGTGPKQIRDRKCPGYTQLLSQKAHRRHFPDTTLDTFFILFVCPTPNRRDTVRKAVAKNQVAPSWRFACKQDLTAGTFLYEPIWYRCMDDQARPLVMPK